MSARRARARRPRAVAGAVAVLVTALVAAAGLAGAAYAAPSIVAVTIDWPTPDVVMVTGAEVGIHGTAGDPSASVEVMVVPSSQVASIQGGGHAAHTATWTPAPIVDSAGHWRHMYTPTYAGAFTVLARTVGDPRTASMTFSVIGDAAPAPDPGPAPSPGPDPVPGDGTILRPGDGNPYARSGLGEFVAKCEPSHQAYHDPIVAPGNPSIWHLHQFFGNRTTDHRSTDASLRRQPSSCDPGVDSSAYWVPALVDGEISVEPTSITVYYQTKYPQNPAAVRTIPQGLRMIAGSAMARANQSDQVVQWSCVGGGPVNTPIIPDCGVGSLEMLIQFPDCWNGTDLDSADHKSHMAYSSGQSCPASHPVLLPKIEYRIEYPASGAGVTLSSDVPMGGMGRALPGQSAHGDFINVWDAAELQRRVDDCLRAARVCDTSGTVIR